jgi:CheY-like chemotaxis protein
MVSFPNNLRPPFTGSIGKGERAMVLAGISGPILIVEDNKKTASLVALYLEREGFQTVIAYDGQEAIELTEQHKPLFVILDLMLPLVDGWEVCRQIRRSSDVPILMLTARGEEIDRVSGLTLGADDYVVKPFSQTGERAGSWRSRLGSGKA